MTSPALDATLDPSLPRSASGYWKPGLIAVAGALVAFGALFSVEVQAAVQVWIDSTAYNHCFLVIPIVAYLLAERRDDLRGLQVTPLPIAALAALPLTVAWLAAERLGIMEGRQLLVIALLEVLFLAVLGLKLFRAMSGPLLYLVFLVPFGEFLTPRLQDITTVFVRHGLDWLRIPAFIDGYVIEIPEGVFYVAEACAGLRFLIASVAFGCLYALLMYRSAGRRMAFILASIVVPVIANGFRALGIVVLGHWLGSAQAAAADHVLYGWIFFSLVILLLIVLGLPFRQDTPHAPVVWTRGARPTVPQLRIGMASAAIVVGFAAIGPSLAFGLNRSVVAVPVTELAIDPAPGCVSQATPLAAQSTPVGRLVTQRVACHAALFDIRVVAFSPQTTAGPVLAERRRLIRPLESEDTVESWLVDGSREHSLGWRLVHTSEPASATAVALLVDGTAIRPGLAMRARLAWTSLIGATRPPVLITVQPVVNWKTITPQARQAAEAGLTDFLLTHPHLMDEAVAALAR